MDTYALPDPQRLNVARNQFLDGKPLPEDLLPSPVARSWSRSREAGVLPWQSRLDWMLISIRFGMKTRSLLNMFNHKSSGFGKVWAETPGLYFV
ncbi:hypothetical protein IQ22_04644 [Pseudomonas duriflava]|uniref:Uncharacterized protein n=1 Tax=Pseudomonas duriflava TaxID=459528 RepID=A0A562PLF7_9PSED|nr:hypothetical protein [Pseudomonas duriflava]TWI45218.1 hypothetical protein IQ22_04644 [Pseudomonas duriflava]